MNMSRFSWYCDLINGAQNESHLCFILNVWPFNNYKLSSLRVGGGAKALSSRLV